MLTLQQELDELTEICDLINWDLLGTILWTRLHQLQALLSPFTFNNGGTGFGTAFTTTSAFTLGAGVACGSGVGGTVFINAGSVECVEINSVGSGYTSFAGFTGPVGINSMGVATSGPCGLTLPAAGNSFQVDNCVVTSGSSAAVPSIYYNSVL